MNDSGSMGWCPRCALLHRQLPLRGSPACGAAGTCCRTWLLTRCCRRTLPTADPGHLAGEQHVDLTEPDADDGGPFRGALTMLPTCIPVAVVGSVPLKGALMNSVERVGVTNAVRRSSAQLIEQSADADMSSSLRVRRRWLCRSYWCRGHGDRSAVRAAPAAGWSRTPSGRAVRGGRGVDPLPVLGGASRPLPGSRTSVGRSWPPGPVSPPRVRRPNPVGLASSASVECPVGAALRRRLRRAPR